MNYGDIRGDSEDAIISTAAELLASLDLKLICFTNKRDHNNIT